LDEKTTILCSHKIDVGKYNDIMITNCFSHFIIYSMHIHSNIFGVEKLDIGANNPHSNPLKKIVINIKIMLTKKKTLI
jgi:hypothetical protein